MRTVQSLPPLARESGSDYHQASIDIAGKRAADAGVTDRARFEVPSAQTFSGTGYELIATFDCLHDMGDPVGAARHIRQALNAKGTRLIVEPLADDTLADNLNPVGRVNYSFSTFLCVPNARSHPAGTPWAPRPASRPSARSPSRPGSPGSAGPPTHHSTPSSRPVPERHHPTTRPKRPTLKEGRFPLPGGPSTAARYPTTSAARWRSAASPTSWSPPPRSKRLPCTGMPTPRASRATARPANADFRTAS